MKKTDFPLKKTFEQDFINEWGDTLFTLRYDQATLHEYHEFFNLSQDERILELYKLVRKQVKRTLLEKVLDFFRIHRTYKMEKVIDIQLVIKNIIANRFRIYDSIYTEKGKRGKSGLYSANLSIVCQKYCIAPHDLYKHYTLEQYLWMLDGIIYQANDMTTEWQGKNRMAMLDKEALRLRAQQTRKSFETRWFNNI